MGKSTTDQARADQAEYLHACFLCWSGSRVGAQACRTTARKTITALKVVPSTW